MEKEIDGIKYTLIPIPPYASPYSTLTGDLLKRKALTTEEAEAISNEIKMAMQKLFAETVTPTPKVEHHTQLFSALQELTSTVMKEAGIFRQDTRPDTEKSSADGARAPQAPQ